jgi:hypothetical protein
LGTVSVDSKQFEGAGLYRCGARDEDDGTGLADCESGLIVGAGGEVT